MKISISLKSYFVLSYLYFFKTSFSTLPTFNANLRLLNKNNYVYTLLSFTLYMLRVFLGKKKKKLKVLVTYIQ